MTRPDERPRLPRVPATVRIAATYPATDGRAPESVEVIWETAFPEPAVIERVIAALAAVTKDRP